MFSRKYTNKINKAAILQYLYGYNNDRTIIYNEFKPLHMSLEDKYFPDKIKKRNELYAELRGRFVLEFKKEIESLMLFNLASSMDLGKIYRNLIVWYWDPKDASEWEYAAEIQSALLDECLLVAKKKMPGIDTDFLLEVKYTDLGHSHIKQVGLKKSKVEVSTKQNYQEKLYGLQDKIIYYINSLKELEMQTIQSEKKKGFFDVMRDYSWSRLMLSGNDGSDRMPFALSFEVDGKQNDIRIKSEYLKLKSKFISEGISLKDVYGFENLDSYMSTHGRVFTRGFTQTYEEFFRKMTEFRDIIGWNKRIFAEDKSFAPEFLIWMKHYI